MPLDSLRPDLLALGESVTPPRARWHKPKDVRDATGLLLLIIAVGWLGGQIIAAALLNESVLAFLGITP